ncbi:MAG: hypothetical protein ABR962_10505 [Candidatus Bathyarchaeia archaeon]
MENKDKIPIIISIFSLLVAFSSVGLTAYFSLRQNSLSQEQNNLVQAQNNLSQELYELQVANMRANMSILVDPQSNQNWTFVGSGLEGGSFLTVDGTLVNEGSRTALLRSMSLSVTYHYSDGTPYTTTPVEYFDLPKYCYIANTTIAEKGEATFSMGMFIQSEVLAIVGGSYTSHSAYLSIGGTMSDNFTISVTYYDGVGNLQSQQEFSTHLG